MKKALLVLGLIALVSCQKHITVTDPITVESPNPTRQITKVTLTDTEQDYMAAGNAMAFRFMDKVYDGSNLIISPLSLQ